MKMKTPCPKCKHEEHTGKRCRVFVTYRSLDLKSMRPKYERCPCTK